MPVKATYATGRRKTSSARVYLMPRALVEETKKVEKAPAKGRGKAKEEVVAPEPIEEGEVAMFVNGLPYRQYFPRATTQMVLRQPFELTERIDTYHLKVLVNGGGKSGQAGAVLHGVSRALQKIEPSLRSVLKKAGFLTRDPRVVERKKPGRHKARKSTQFSKR